MNYFEIFGIPVSLNVNKTAHTKKYFDLQKQYHPDFFGNASNTEKEEALEQSSLINKAWKIFQSKDETIKYVLQLKGLLEEEEKYQLPNDFLMEVMDLNEMRMDGAEPDEIAARTTVLQEEIYSKIKNTIANYKDGITSDEELLKVKEYYYKKKYLDRLLNTGIQTY